MMPAAQLLFESRRKDMYWASGVSEQRYDVIKVISHRQLSTWAI